MKNSVLVVEDDLIQNRMLEHMLLKNGYVVYCAFDGFEALDILTKNKVDIIISDVLMDKMDGFEFKREVNKNQEWANIPFVFLTNQNTPESKTESENLGANMFLIKPYIKLDIVDIIKKIILAEKH